MTPFRCKKTRRHVRDRSLNFNAVFTQLNRYRPEGNKNIRFTLNHVDAKILTNNLHFDRSYLY